MQHDYWKNLENQGYQAAKESVIDSYSKHVHQSVPLLVCDEVINRQTLSDRVIMENISLRDLALYELVFFQDRRLKKLLMTTI